MTQLELAISEIQKLRIFSIFRGEIRLPKSPRLRKSPPPQLFEMIQIKNELGETVKFGSQWYEFSTPGNILYGFYGLAAGFAKQELHVGAGVAQWQDHVNKGSEIGDWSTLLDTSDDYYAIEFGFFLYENYYANDGELTESEFLEALSLFGDADKMAIKPTPEDPYIPAEDEYETDDFYQ